MNKRMVAGFLGRICYLEAVLMLIPFVVGLIYREGPETLLSFIYTIGILVVCGFFLSLFEPEQTSYTLVDGFAITALSWFLLSFFGGLPFVFSGEIQSVIDATFEMTSGFTTTGSSILQNVEALSQSMLFWRSFSHLVGGMGVLVFAFALIPELGEGSVSIMKAEVPGPEFGKLVAKNKNTAAILYTIYIAMTGILVLLLMLAGMQPFDALIHAFGTAGTGGFSNKALSVGHFNNPMAEYILSFGMIIFGINFNLYYFLLRKEFKTFFSSEELRLFLKVLAAAVLLLMLVMHADYLHFEPLFRDAFFTVTTIISTTGFGTVDFTLWPLFAQLIILLLMFSGSMAGSTAGGIKMSRILIYLKGIRRDIIQAVHPRKVVPITVDGRLMSNIYIKRTFIYLGTYFMVFTVLTLLVSISENDFMTAFSAVAATINNIGPGMGNIGPASNFASFNPFAKVTLICSMIIGRLEIYPVLILLLKRTWTTKY